MIIQVNSDKTVVVDAGVKSFVRDEAARILARFEDKVTRIEVHLNDINSRKTGPPDKRCLVEARPAGARPISTTAVATRLDAAIGMALRKMQRSLTSFFGRQSRASGHGAPAARRKPKTVAAASRSKTPAKTARAAKAAVDETSPSAATAVSLSAAAGGAGRAKASGRSPKKKPIHQARRKAWPAR